MSRVSVTVPIWFSLTRIEFATPASMPRCKRAGFVQNRSSPTSSIFDPSAAVIRAQPSQSFSASPSSTSTMG